MRPHLLATLAALAALAVLPARAETIGGNPGPEHNYVCPHADGKPALDCYLDAVKHLYTMCRNVKAIEIIEFGYDKSSEGTNGAKSEYCLDKQKQNIARPFKAALRETSKKKRVAEALHKLNEMWLSAMAQLQWRSGESDDDYKARVARPYAEFDDSIASIRTSYAATDTSPEPTRTVKSGRSSSRAKAKIH
ncbi:MAG TPA: hypothetical protein VF059_03025 [Casimicrobiaceae bacterium]